MPKLPGSNSDLPGGGGDGEFPQVPPQKKIKIKLVIKKLQLHLSVTIDHIGANSILDNTIS